MIEVTLDQPDQRDLKANQVPQPPAHHVNATAGFQSTGTTSTSLLFNALLGAKGGDSTSYHCGTIQ